MLKDMIDVQNYTKRLASKLPDLASEISLESKGVSEVDLTTLADKIRLPPIYLTCAAQWRLYGVSIGYFGLWPSFGRQDNLATALLEANLNSGEAAAIAHSNGLVIVAREEANWICVGSASSDHPDIVYHISSMASLQPRITEIANSFKHFIILAANLHEVAHSGSYGFGDGIVAISDCCNAVGCYGTQAEFWEQKATELLS
jgi:hypothetical protein